MGALLREHRQPRGDAGLENHPSHEPPVQHATDRAVGPNECLSG
jgi:hypothetical protein